MATMRLRGKERSIAATRLDARSEAGGWILPGAIMGIAAGGVFLIFEMVVAGIVGQSAFGPFRMIAAIVLGEGVLQTQPSVGLSVVVPVVLDGQPRGAVHSPYFLLRHRSRTDVGNPVER